MKNKEAIENKISFIETCNLLKTVSRYIKQGILKPEKIKSQKGSIEYRFNQAQLEAFKIPRTDKIRPDNL